MGRVDRDRGQQRVDFALKVVLSEIGGLLIEFIPLEQSYSLLAKGGQQLAVPAFVLSVDKAVDFGGKNLQRFVGAKSIVARLTITILNALHQTGLADLDVFIQVGAGDSEKFDALQQGIVGRRLPRGPGD